MWNLHECAQGFLLKDIPYLHITRHSCSVLIMFEHKKQFHQMETKSLSGADKKKSARIIFAEEIEFQSDFFCFCRILCLWIHLSCDRRKIFRHVLDIFGCKKAWKMKKLKENLIELATMKRKLDETFISHSSVTSDEVFFW